MRREALEIRCVCPPRMDEYSIRVGFASSCFLDDFSFSWDERLTHAVAKRLLWTGIVTGTIAAIIACGGVAAKAVVLGSAEGGWTYDYIRDIPSQTAVVILIVGMAIGAAVRWLTPSQEARGEWMVVIAWLVLATLCQALLVRVAPFTLEEIFRSDVANSFYAVTQRYRADSVLEWFAELRGHWPLHAHSNMPGKLMLLYALELVSNDPVVLPWLLLAISNLGAVLLYLLVRDLFADRHLALYALVLYLFVPAKLFFFPLMNTVTPVAALACMLMFERWVQRPNLWYGSVAAVSLYVLVFFEPIPLVIGALIALLLARVLFRGDIPLKTLSSQGLLVIVMFFGVIALVREVFDFDLVGAFRQVATAAAEFNVIDNRPYLVWVRRNLVEFAFGVGVCQAVLFWFAAADGWRSRAGSFLNQPIALLSVGLIAMLLALDLAGINRGEVIRLWIFLACLFQVPAAYVCVRLRSRAAFAVVLVLTIVQSALAKATIGFVVP